MFGHVKKYLAPIALVLVLFTYDAPLNASLPSHEEIVSEYTQVKKTLDTGNKVLSACGFLKLNETQSPLMYTMVSECCKKLNIPVPLVLIFKGNIASRILEEIGIDYRINAFATSLTSSLGVIFIGEELIAGLSPEQLEAVIAHELGHIYHNHIPKRLAVMLVSVLTMSYVASYLPANMDVFSLIGNPEIAAHYYFILKSSLGQLIWSKYARVQEYEADATAASIIENPGAMQTALDKIMILATDKWRLITWFNEFWQIHPTTGNRKRALQAQIQEKNHAALAA